MQSLDPQVRVLVVDNHPSVRHGLALLMAEEGMCRCCEAAGRTDALDLAKRERFDIVVVDLSLPSDDALALIAELRSLGMAVLVCSMHEEPCHVRQALAAGACGYITKREVPQELTRAMRDILEGWMLISPRAAEGLR